MNAVLLSLHVVAAIVLIGPITVAASVFPRYARLAAAPVPADGGTVQYRSMTPEGAWAVAAAMHRISRGYAIPALAVPVFGVGVGSALGVLTQRWVLVSMALTALAGVLLVAGIVPGQRQVLARASAGRAESLTHPAAADANASQLRRLGMVTGGFSIIWVVVVVLMIVRPGSTTGV
jgi:hypothetical protein